MHIFVHPSCCNNTRARSLSIKIYASQFWEAESRRRQAALELLQGHQPHLVPHPHDLSPSQMPHPQMLSHCGEDFSIWLWEAWGQTFRPEQQVQNPLRSIPKSNEMIKDCKQLLSSEGPSCTRGWLGSGLSGCPPAKLAQTFTQPESLDSGGPAAAQRKRQNSNSIIE